jgi:hypothetical protein
MPKVWSVRIVENAQIVGASRTQIDSALPSSHARKSIMRDHRSSSALKTLSKRNRVWFFPSSKEKAKPGFLPPPDARG